MIDAVKSLLFRGDGTTVVYECRRCGTTLDSDGAECPACGCEETARFSTG